MVFHLISRGIGINLNAEFRKLNQSQYWDAQLLHQSQLQLLTQCVEFARQNSPYYAKILSTQGKVDRMEKFIELPVLTKKEVQENFESIVVSKPNIRYITDTTSGSTGTPLKIRINKDAYAKHFAAKCRALMWHSVNFCDRQARLWGLTLDNRERIYWRIRDVLQNRIRFVAYESDSHKLSSFYKKCCQFKPTYINGYTSSIHRFALFITHNNLDTLGWGTKVVLPTAEMLYPHQRNDIQAAFGCPVMNEYGCSEVPGIAYECEFGNLHISHENIILELLEDDGKPIPYKKEQLGKVTLTPLFYRAMPLIRYQNGDLAVWSSEESCPCGRQRGLPTLKKVVGRSVDILVDESGNESHWTAIYYGVKKIFDNHVVDEFQVIQKSNTHIHFNIVQGVKFHQGAIRQVEERVKAILGNSVYVTYELVDFIPRTESGKLKYFISVKEGSIDEGEKSS